MSADIHLCYNTCLKVLMGNLFAEDESSHELC